MLQAMNTGHDGSLTTLHANTPARRARARGDDGADGGLRPAGPRHPPADRLGARPDRAPRAHAGRRRAGSPRSPRSLRMEGDVVTLQDLFEFRSTTVAARRARSSATLRCDRPAPDVHSTSSSAAADAARPLPASDLRARAGLPAGGGAVSAGRWLAARRSRRLRWPFPRRRPPRRGCDRARGRRAVPRPRAGADAARPAPLAGRRRRASPRTGARSARLRVAPASATARRLRRDPRRSTRARACAARPIRDAMAAARAFARRRPARPAPLGVIFFSGPARAC